MTGLVVKITGIYTQQQFGKMAGLVLNSTVFFRLSFGAKLKISASICPPLRQAAKRERTTVDFCHVNLML